ncbi:MAG: hypothetical protein IKZ68_03800 [Bacilli bacterium]|nr:hypothetical protein [Bacilli bacterium]
MDNFWDEEEGSEWDKEAFKQYGSEPAKAEKKQNKTKYVLLISGIGLLTVVVLVLGLVFGLGAH